MLFKSGVEAFNQNVAVEGLGQEARRAGLQRCRAGALSGKSRNEDEWRAMSLGEHVSLQFDTAHLSHLDVCNDARRALQIVRLQELFGRCECMDGVTKRPHEIGGRGANGPIIVDDRDHWSFGQSVVSCGR